MEEILELDRKLFLELNSNFHTPWLDQFMMFLTTTLAWLPLYLLILFFLIRAFKKDTWMVLLAIGLTVAIADQVISSFMKPFFERLRPSHEPGMRDIVAIVDGYRGGKYGFASSHAANTFGIATLIWLMLRGHRPWMGLLFLWPALVGYTRIYLGVHYPGDILAGFVVGFFSALISWYLWRLLHTYRARRAGLRTGQ